MTKIGLIDVDGHNWPNLPLMKLSAWHKSQNDTVEMWLPFEHYDKVYMSKVFMFTPDIETPILADEIERGGTGYDTQIKLPRDIEHMYPDYALYGDMDTAYGFLTRGCPRGCPFCVVSEKEDGISYNVADLDEFWRMQKYIKLLDPNLLATRDPYSLLHMLGVSQAWVDFTQGLDVRLMDADTAALIRDIKVKLVHFAWDNPRQDLTAQFERVKQWLGYPACKMIVYVLTNYNSTSAEDLYRIETLKQLGYDPYVMIYDKENAPREAKRLQRWVNNRIIFKSCPRFADYKA